MVCTLRDSVKVNNLASYSNFVETGDARTIALLQHVHTEARLAPGSPVQV